MSRVGSQKPSSAPRPSLSVGRFSTVVILSTVTFYFGVLAGRAYAREPFLELLWSLGFAVVAALLPALFVGRAPGGASQSARNGEARSVTGRIGRLRLRASVSLGIMIAMTLVRWALLHLAQWSGQGLSAVTFLAVLAVGVVFVYPDPAPAPEGGGL